MTMFHPVLASSFEGVEIVMFVPIIAIASLVGLTCALLRVHWLAICCGVVSALVGFLSLLFAIGMHGVASLIDFTCGLVAILIACALIFIKRKEETR
jgi:hypothetical protein